MSIPAFNDGYFTLYHIKESDDVQTKKALEKDIDIWYEELSVSDKLRSQLNSTDVDVAMKIRIPQYKKMDSLCVVKIADKYYKVYNAYHFTNNDGYKLSDVTLTNWEDHYEEE